MREIKFRAWQDNQMLTSPISSNYGLSRFFALLYEDAKLMQYTGLTDKNGVEVFEGDILKCDGLRIVIQYSGCAFEGRYLGPQKDLWSPIRNNNYLQWVVIGNIHQNPELLKP